MVDGSEEGSPIDISLQKAQAPEKSPLLERRQNMAGKMFQEVVATRGETGNLWQKDQGFVDTVSRNLIAVLESTEISNPQHPGYQDIKRTAQELRATVPGLLRRLSDKVGEFDQLRQRELSDSNLSKIEESLKQAVNSTDQLESARILQDVVNRFNRFASGATALRREQGQQRQALTNNADITSQNARVIYARVVEQAHRELPGSEAYVFRQSSGNLSQVIKNELLNLTPAERAYLDNLREHGSLLNRITKDILATYSQPETSTDQLPSEVS